MSTPKVGGRDDEIGRLVWDRCVIGLAEVDLNGRWLAVNPALCDLLEYSESELQARTFQQITHPEDVDDDLNMVRRLKDRRLDHYTMSKRYITKRGRVIWIKLRVDPVTTETGDVVCFLSQIVPSRDVTAVEKLNLKTGAEKDTLGAFLKREWKWVLVATIAVVTFIAQQYYIQQSMTDRLDRLEGVIEKLVEAK